MSVPAKQTAQRDSLPAAQRVRCFVPVWLHDRTVSFSRHGEGFWDALCGRVFGSRKARSISTAAA